MPRPALLPQPGILAQQPEPQGVLATFQRDPRYEYGNLLPFRKPAAGGSAQWGLGYSEAIKSLYDAFTAPGRAWQGEQMTPADAMNFALGSNVGGMVMGRAPVGSLGMNNITIGQAAPGTWVVKAGGKEVGRANLADSGDYLTSVRLEPEYRGQGLGRELYDFIEREIGRRLKPSPTYQTPDARRFWEARSKDVSRQDLLLGAVDKLAYERGGWAPIRELPQGNEAVWQLIDKGLIEESAGYVRRKQ